MAEHDSTLGYPLAGSKIPTKAEILEYPGRFTSNKPTIDQALNEQMDSLRTHINTLLSLSLLPHEKNRLIKIYWELEFLVEELRLMPGGEELPANKPRHSP
ncbi:MAG: hypothetical protein OEY89_10215 [Gammaproteobacteria bacterium]|nr:hypothetical protein [Gammaproteobacteria bacterium]